MANPPLVPDSGKTSERRMKNQLTSKRWLDEQMFARKRQCVRPESSATSTPGYRQAQVNSSRFSQYSSSLFSQGRTFQQCLENSGKSIPPKERTDPVVSPIFTRSLGSRSNKSNKSNANKRHEASKSTSNAKPFVEKPRPKKEKAVAKPEFTIFEDDTATKVANPTPEEIKSDPDYCEFGDESAICFYTSLIRHSTKRNIQENGYIYATGLVKWLQNSAIQVEKKVPYSGIGIQQRLTTWTQIQDRNHDYGISHPNGYKHEYPKDEEEWFTVDAIEELAKMMTDLDDLLLRYGLERAALETTSQEYEEVVDPILDLLAAYCFGRGCGMDVGSPEIGDYLEDGRRNPKFFERLITAWSTIVKSHLGEDFGTFWSNDQQSTTWFVDQIRDTMKRKGVNWKAMEHFWGDKYPPSDTVSRFGGEARQDKAYKSDAYAAEMFEMGIDGYEFE